MTKPMPDLKADAAAVHEWLSIGRPSEYTPFYAITRLADMADRVADTEGLAGALYPFAWQRNSAVARRSAQAVQDYLRGE